MLTDKDLKSRLKNIRNYIISNIHDGKKKSEEQCFSKHAYLSSFFEETLMTVMRELEKIEKELDDENSFKA